MEILKSGGGRENQVMTSEYFWSPISVCGRGSIHAFLQPVLHVAPKKRSLLKDVPEAEELKIQQALDDIKDYP